ncbi:hypothetical protein P154DRAFT_488080 [Amniculicola lignicola CBS 123094]|uniref:Mediator of RNA polymerase II transcription subunit 18 n=1 Tax=Amniculicola lignicola CBS 123094 TaxID=1392246 RepID=A0A6A5WP33_9PLEO|nr:hypothetical protein P154DRAFT_488080 [Amniculicola lignicola CBS 123094]
MHELLLYGQVPRARHELVLKILAGVAAMQPRRILERHIVYKPQREPEEPGSNLRRGGTQAVAGDKKNRQVAPKELCYTQLVQQLMEKDFGSNNDQQQGNVDALTAKTDASGPQWAWVFHDIPDAGDRGVLVRLASSSEVAEGKPHDYVVAAGNKFVSEYYVEGHRFVLGSVILFLHRVLQEPGVRVIETTPKSALPAFAALEPLDPSGQYLLEAKIRVSDLNTPAVVEGGIEELKKFKQSMVGCVELFVPDRLQLDTRVKYKPKPVAHPGR